MKFGMVVLRTFWSNISKNVESAMSLTNKLSYLSVLSITMLSVFPKLSNLLSPKIFSYFFKKRSCDSFKAVLLINLIKQMIKGFLKSKLDILTLNHCQKYENKNILFCTHQTCHH